MNKTELANQITTATSPVDEALKIVGTIDNHYDLDNVEWVVSHGVLRRPYTLDLEDVMPDREDREKVIVAVDRKRATLPPPPPPRSIHDDMETAAVERYNAVMAKLDAIESLIVSGSTDSK